MTGPEHYKYAEALLEASEGARPEVFAAAQVHATLALVAVTAFAANKNDPADRVGVEGHAWARVTA